MPKELTIRLGGHGEHVSVALLIETLENTLAILRNLEPKLSTDGQPLRWEIVRASMESPLTITLKPEAQQGGQNGATSKGERVIHTYLHGLRAIKAKSDMPQYFDEEILLAAKKMVQAVTKENGKLELYAPDEEPVETTPDTAEQIEQAVSKAIRIYNDYATVEGKLETISTHGGNFIVIWEVLTNNRVECAVTAELLEEAKNLLRKRVAVSGRARYRNGKPISLQVESIRVLRDASELPQPADIGVVNITDGVSSEEHVRRMRDDS